MQEAVDSAATPEAKAAAQTEYDKQFEKIKCFLKYPLGFLCSNKHMVVEGDTPTYTALAKAVTKENFQDICNNCPHHRDG